MRQILKSLSSLALPKNYYQNKKILITGGGSGLGEQMALHYAKLGGEVTILGRNPQKLDKASREINVLDDVEHNVACYSLDVRDNQAVSNLANSMMVQDKLPDIIINNAAGNFICPTEALSVNGWNTVLDIVLKGTMNMTLEFGKRQIEAQKPATYLNISTTYAETGSAFVVPSSVAKAGCNNLTKSLAAEWGKYGMRFLSVAPGPIYTEGAFSRLDPTGKFQKVAEDKLPLGRLGEKAEIANLVTYLTSDHNNWMTGQVINFDGGEVVGNSGEFNLLHQLTEDQWKMILPKKK